MAMDNCFFFTPTSGVTTLQQVGAPTLSLTCNATFTMLRNEDHPTDDDCNDPIVAEKSLDGTPFWGVSECPFQGISDLMLGDEKGHLEEAGHGNIVTSSFQPQPTIVKHFLTHLP